MLEIALSVLSLLYVQDIQNGVLQEGFESARVGWLEEGGNVPRRVRQHRISSELAHSGRSSEQLELTVGLGTHLYYAYRIGHAPVIDELQISLWVHCDRPNIQILARVVFPNEKDEETKQYLYTLLPGDVYNAEGRWQRLAVKNPQSALFRQVQLIRAQQQRNIDYRGAYIDRIYVNVYGGPGSTLVHFDDLRVSPVISGTSVKPATLGAPGDFQGPDVTLGLDQILVDGRPRWIRGIDAPGVESELLRVYGFDAVTARWPLDLKLIETHVRNELWLIPELGPADTPPLRLSEFPLHESVLFWQLGGSLAERDLDQIDRLSNVARKLNPARPLAALVDSGHWLVSRRIGIQLCRTTPIGSPITLLDWRNSIERQRSESRPGTYHFSWLGAQAAYIETTTGNVDVGPSAEQLHLLALASLAAGNRGYGFVADSSLGRTTIGRQRLYQMGLTNLQFRLLAPYLSAGGSVATFPAQVEALERPTGFTRQPAATKQTKGEKESQRASAASGSGQIQATMIRSRLGLVVIPVWYGPHSQYVTGQLAANRIGLVVPGIPQDAYAWAVSPAGVRLVKTVRLNGGTKLILEEFDLGAMILIPANYRDIDALKAATEQTRPWAAQWANHLAESRLNSTRQTIAELASLIRLPSGIDRRLAFARDAVNFAQQMMSQEKTEAAYVSARRALRAIRLVEGLCWREVTAKWGAAQSTPYATSFASLPEHLRFLRKVHQLSFSDQLLPEGDFGQEETASIESLGWVTTPSEDGRFDARFEQQGKRGTVLKLQRSLGENDALAERESSLQTREMSVNGGDIIQVKLAVNIPLRLRGGASLTLSDSIDGRAFWKSTGPLEWKHLTFYRRIESQGKYQIRFGMSGAGSVAIDSVSVSRAKGNPLLSERPVGEGKSDLR